MKGDLNTLGFYFIPQDVLESIWKETKEYAFAGVITEFAAALARRLDPDTTTKRLEVTEVGFGVIAAFERRQCVVFTGKRVRDTQVVVESIGPETRVEYSTGQHDTKSVANSLMCTLDGAILV
jgi:hypothetical protein